MFVHCVECGHIFNDETCWTLCPHGPLWAAHDAYCREHDLVDCHLHGPQPTDLDQYRDTLIRLACNPIHTSDGIVISLGGMVTVYPPQWESSPVEHTEWFHRIVPYRVIRWEPRCPR